MFATQKMPSKSLLMGAEHTVWTFDHYPDNRVFNIDCEHLPHVPKAKESFREELWPTG